MKVNIVIMMDMIVDAAGMNVMMDAMDVMDVMAGMDVTVAMAEMVVIVNVMEEEVVALEDLQDPQDPLGLQVQRAARETKVLKAHQESKVL